MLNINFTASPLQKIPSGHWFEGSYRVFVKREDLLHKTVGGNKWRKLKYNLIKAQKEAKYGILTFGGAFSNHLYATAAAGQLFGFSSIGIVRGESTEPLNPTLRFARSQGMELRFVSRSLYRDQAALLDSLQSFRPNYYFLPEGGTNALALPGCAELIKEVHTQLDTHYADYYCAACGTGGTLAGMITALKDQEKALGFSVLKGNFHQKDIKQLLQVPKEQRPTQWSVNTDYHFGGYARHSPILLDFIKSFYLREQIPLDPIYTGKLFYGVFELIKAGYFPQGSTIILIHSGGLQGIAGFNERFGENLLGE